MDLHLDVDDYWTYVKATDLYRQKQYYGGHEGKTFPEKSLEHYVATKLLEPNAEDVYVDVASQHSPVPEIYAQRFGCTVYKQDLSYPDGVHDGCIGGDAAAMPVPDAFASKMALHCSFEHFENDSDIRFIREIQRVLRPGGRVCIVPLYLNSRYTIHTDPAVHPHTGLTFESDATLCCLSRFRNRHARQYDVAHFVERIQHALDALSLTIYRLTNARDVHPSCYAHFAAVLAKPVAVSTKPAPAIRRLAQVDRRKT